MGESSKGELFSYMQESQLLETVLPCLVFFLIHNEMGNGVLTGWGGAE